MTTYQEKMETLEKMSRTEMKMKAIETFGLNDKWTIDFVMACETTNKYMDNTLRVLLNCKLENENKW